MDSISNMSPSELDEHFLRRSFDVARRALANGNHPFGAILVDQNRKGLIETENGSMPAHDGTAHAERLLATRCKPVAGTGSGRSSGQRKGRRRGKVGAIASNMKTSSRLELHGDAGIERRFVAAVGDSTGCRVGRDARHPIGVGAELEWPEA